jgi:hypothetical protein
VPIGCAGFARIWKIQRIGIPAFWPWRSLPGSRWMPSRKPGDCWLMVNLWNFCGTFMDVDGEEENGQKYLKL